MASSPLLSGQLDPWSTWGEYNNIIFAVRQALNKMQTATLVRIEACTNDGDRSPVGFVDVTPLVNQIDGSTPPNSTPHGTIFNIPYLRMQGGANAIIMDPHRWDIGIAVFASRDINNVKSTKAQANPGSFRSYAFEDGIYLGGVLNGNPLQYIQFNETGINIVSPTVITLQAPSIVIDGALAISGGNATMTGNIAVTGSVKANGIDLQTHTHTSEAVGTPTSPPIP